MLFFICSQGKHYTRSRVLHFVWQQIAVEANTWANLTAKRCRLIALSSTKICLVIAVDNGFYPLSTFIPAPLFTQKKKCRQASNLKSFALLALYIAYFYAASIERLFWRQVLGCLPAEECLPTSPSSQSFPFF